MCMCVYMRMCLQACVYGNDSVNVFGDCVCMRVCLCMSVCLCMTVRMCVRIIVVVVVTVFICVCLR